MAMFCCLVTRAGLGAEDPVIASSTSAYRGTNYATELHVSDINRAPEWNGASKPPLSFSEANSNACKYLEEEIGRPQSSALFMGKPPLHGLPPWLARNVELRAVDPTSTWYYRMDMSPLISGSYNWEPITVFITLDGKVATVHPSK